MYYYCNKCDILCLQETYSDIESECIWSVEWGGAAFFAHGSNKSRGVAILCKKHIEIEDVKVCNGYDGRYQIMNFKYKNEKFTLVNLYAQNKDNPNFFLEIFNKISESDGHKVLLGDFNLVLDCEMDRKSSSKKVANHDKSALLIKQYMEDTYLTDIWRDRNPDKKVFSYTRRKPFAGSRIDLCILEQQIAGWVEKIEIKPGFKSDHSHILLELIQLPKAEERGYGNLTTSF